MSVLINFKICDNDKACSGMAICPNNVFEWDEKKSTLVIHNERCVSCGLCEKACMVSAIRVAKTEEEYKKIEKEFDDDPRTINDLLVDRYGATPIDEAMIGKEQEIDIKLLDARRPLIVELYNEDSIMCLLKSIPIKNIADTFDTETRYRKIEVISDDILKKYEIKELPSLLFFNKGNYVGKIEGYIDEDSKEELLTKVQEFKNTARD
ncbi:MAG: 4Fe-4S binding protein [Clostridia bacterium]|nr:4Fe-4S binding protein [Clostridia bacterium]